MSDIFLIIGGISLLLQPVALIYICLCILRRPAAAGAVTNGSRAPLTAVVL